MLFHYHFWTPHVEETEEFYVKHGFRISQRIGKYEGSFQKFNPPLTWDDFHEKKILFRIIEARKGTVNITFGYGKKTVFDHIGFLVSNEDYDQICKNARKMNWEVDVGERRTFIATPYGFRIELQINTDVVDVLVDSEGSNIAGETVVINKLTIETQKLGLSDDLTNLFGKPVESIVSLVGDQVTIREAVLKGGSSIKEVDPNGVEIG